MEVSIKNKTPAKTSPLAKPIFLAIFLVYIIVAGYTMAHHEMWGDELHAWNIAKASGGFSSLIYNTRFEGHPPAWFTLLWCMSKFTHNLAYIQLTHLIIAAFVVFVVVFYAPFPVVTKVLIPFGYYFLFEYAILSRNYAMGVLAAFLVCILLKKGSRHKLVPYYALLFFMSNFHLFAMLLAGSLHVYFLMSQIEQKKKNSTIVFQALLGILVFLPAAYFIISPGSGGADTGLLASKLGIKNMLAIGAQAPLRTFVPIPAWWKYDFWNTQFLIVLQQGHTLLKIANLLICLIISYLAYYILKDNRKSVALFFINLLLSILVGTIIPLNSERYVGFIFIGFLAAYWLRCYETSVPKSKRNIVNLLLTVQATAGIFMVWKDIRLPFSNSYRVVEMVGKVPPNEKIVTDHWALNTVCAYIDTPFYCLDLQKTASFVLWGIDMPELIKYPYRYYNGSTRFFELNNAVTSFYMVSMEPPAVLFALDPKFFSAFQVQLVGKVEGAIEKSSNIYLYKINRFVGR